MPVTLDSVMAALGEVIDPEIRRPITDLNMVTPDLVTIDASSVAIKVLLTTAGCPLRTQITKDVTERVGALDGVDNVSVEMGVMDETRRRRCARSSTAVAPSARFLSPVPTPSRASSP